MLFSQTTTTTALLTTLLTLPTYLLALDITIHLPPQKPNPHSLPPTTHATLSSLNGYHSAPISLQNTIVFHNVSFPSSYLLDVHCPTEAFHPLRIDVSSSSSSTTAGKDTSSSDDGVIDGVWETYRGNDWDNKGEAVALSQDGGVVVRAVGGKMYYTERPTFSILSILKNPMILMGLFSMLMFVGMPYLMDNMDPEMKAEFEAHQANGGALGSLMNAAGGGSGGSSQQSPLSNFDMAAYLAGSGKKDSSKK